MSCECAKRDDDFPLEYARAGRFRQGAPRGFTLSQAGHRLAFTRGSEDSNALDLWLVEHLDGTPTESRVLAARDCVDGAEALSPEERARRERLRESGAGITAFSADALLATVTFALSGQLWVCDVASGAADRVGEYDSVVDPRLNARGDAVAFCNGRDFVVYSFAEDRELLRLVAEAETVTYGLSDFIAAEELDRHRGHWWSPDGDQVIVERNDEVGVEVRWISDPTDPAAPARPHRYPAAGTTNSAVSLVVVDLGTSNRSVVEWSADWEYLVDVAWHGERPWLTLSDRAQRNFTTFAISETGLAEVVSQRDEHWVDAGIGLPALAGDRLLTYRDTESGRQLFVDERPLPIGDYAFSRIVSADAHGITLLAYGKPWQLVLLKVSLDGEIQVLSDQAGYANAVANGTYAVVTQYGLDTVLPKYLVLRGNETVHEVTSPVRRPSVTPALSIGEVGGLPTAVLFPESHVRGSHRLPVIVSIYGGPHHARVTATPLLFVDDQWLANQGFAVVVIDNRGNPGKGPAWERAVAGDLAGPVLADQVSALQALGELYPDDLDLSRVGIHGWSFGGYLSALAALERPDVFHAAWAGAPVTEWRLYDTAYTERYLGHPDTAASAYDQSSLLPRAANLRVPLTLIHGFADDNVLAAHSLQLSAALLAAGRPHNFLPLAGVSHMTPQEHISANLLLLMRDFFEASLG